VDVILGRVMQEPPGGGRHQESPADPDHRQRDPEEIEHVGADQDRNDDHVPAIDGHLARELRGEIAVVADGRHEHRRRAERIDDGKQRRRHEHQCLEKIDGRELHPRGDAA
jgi:hypothetical protein